MGSYLNSQLSKKTGFFGLRLWVVIGIGVGAIIVLILFFLSVWLSSRRKSRNAYDKFPSQTQSIPNVSKEIKEVPPAEGVLLTISDKTAEKDAEKVYVHVGFNRKNEHPGSRAIVGVEMGKNYEGSGRRLVLNQTENRKNGKHPDKAPLDYIHERRDSNLQIIRLTPYGEYAGSPRAGSDTLSALSASSSIAEVSHLGWGHWYTLRDLEIATDGFSNSNILGEGGYGIVYRGQLADGTLVAVKNLLNNSRGQAEKEFAQEVEAIGRVRHKNLVRLLGYCIEGNCRMLVYEFVDNGNLEQWLHGPASLSSSPTWEARLKIALGTAKALAYLHEALEPKVVHRDIKASNILLDSQWNAKVSDFGLAKLLGSENTHVKTRVMGTFGYVAPEYANTGYLNERSDVYSFGILLMEIISGRDPVDYSRPAGEVNLVDWIKFMVGQKRSEEVPDPRLDQPPPNRSLKRALLVALRCVDPDATKRPRMGHVVHMIESEDYPSREDRRDERNGKDLVKYLDYTKQETIVDSIVQEASASREVEAVN